MCEKLHSEDLEAIINAVASVITPLLQQQAAHQEIEPEYYTPEEFARLTAMSVGTIKKQLYEHKLKGAVKICGKWRIRRQIAQSALLKGRI